MGCAYKPDLLVRPDRHIWDRCITNCECPCLPAKRPPPSLELDKWEFTCRDLTTNPEKGGREEANEADHNSRHSEPLTVQDSRANHKTVWAVTEDEELFKEYSIRAVVQTVLPDAVLWDELAARDQDLKELKSAIAREYFTMPERKVLGAQFNPVFAELAVVGGLVLQGSRIVVTRSLKDKVVQLAC